MGNQYPVVLLGYTGETTCPKSHKRSRSRMGFDLRPSDVSFCAHTISSCFLSCLISLQLVPAAISVSQLPVMLFASSMSPLGTCLHTGLVPERLEDLVALCEGSAYLMVSSSAGWPVWVFSLQNQKKLG